MSKIQEINFFHLIATILCIISREYLHVCDLKHKTRQFFESWGKIAADFGYLGDFGLDSDKEECAITNIITSCEV